MTAVEICLVRHGESVSNASGVWQGQGDSPLSDRGRAQAEALARALEGSHFDRVLSSDLRRASGTAGALGRPVQTDPRWRELDVGAWEGLTMEQVAERFPEQIVAMRERRPVAIGGGESWPEGFARVDAAMEDLRASLPDGGRAIVFAHGGIIAGFVAGLMGARERFPWPLGRIRNTAWTLLRFDDRGVELAVHNDDTHLDPELRSRQEPRPDQHVICLTAEERESVEGDLVALQRAMGPRAQQQAGTVVPVTLPSSDIAKLAWELTRPSEPGFRFGVPGRRQMTSVLVSKRHRMVLDHGIGGFQI